MKPADVMIVGGGPAGAASAIALAGVGKHVLLIEKEKQAYDKVCGEFLSAESEAYLQVLGINPVALGAVPIRKLRLIANNMQAQIMLPKEFLSLSRRVLDEALLTKAEEVGVELWRGHKAKELNKCDYWQARLDNDRIAMGCTAFLATGKHDLRGWKRPPGWQNDLLGFKMHWRLSQLQQKRLTDFVELFLFPGGYAGLEPIEDGKANLCLLVRRQYWNRLGAKWQNLLDNIATDCPEFRQRFNHAQPLGQRPLAIFSIPYGYICRQSQDGLWRLGDQAAVIPSFAGDGVSIALHSAKCATEHYIQGVDANSFQRSLAKEIRNQIYSATILSQILVRSMPQKIMIRIIRHYPNLLSSLFKATRVSDGVNDEHDQEKE